VEKCHIKIEKILKLENGYIATKRPCNCQSRNIHIVISEKQTFTLLQISSLHSFLKITEVKECAILPFGLTSALRIEKLLKKYKSISYNVNEKKNSLNQTELPCFIYNIFKRPYNVYGVNTNMKKRQTVGSFINKYKKVSRKYQPT
jgi:hypothetical protein